MLWDREANPDVPHKPATPEEVLTDLLDPIDVEDVVLMLLQHQGWILLPSSRMHDTPMYEAALRHREDGHLAVVSVKSGASNPVPVADLAEAAGDAQAYAYSTHRLYSASPGECGVIEITRPQLVGFIEGHLELLPPRIARWLTA